MVRYITIFLLITEEESMESTGSGKKLSDLIKKAIDDGEITTKEYDEILAQANADMQIDPEEKALLNQLQTLIDDKTVKRVK
jgi:hypothetical protein